MKIAVYNVENLFYRDRELIKRSLNDSIHLWLEEFEQLLSGSKGENELRRMRELSFLLGFHKSASEPYAVMRRKAGELYLKKKTFKEEEKAGPWNNWSGWIKVNSNPISTAAVENKAKVIAEANPNILIMQEVEDRQSLLDFNEQFLPKNQQFKEISLMCGNDNKGREIALLLKEGFTITSIRSHCNAWETNGRSFDKDFQEYLIHGPKGEKILVLTSHLEDQQLEKSYSDDRRRLQSEKLKEIYNERRREGHTAIVVAGTFNAPSFCHSVSPLIRETDLLDVKRHQSFNVDLDLGKDAGYFSLGAYRLGVNLRQQDYMMISPELFKVIKDSGLNRKGIFPSNRGQWNCYETVHSERQQASGHPLIWIEI